MEMLEQLYKDVNLFQYRKRYELHAIECFEGAEIEFFEFQYRKRYELHAMEEEQSSNNVLSEFQYRKRYELHAMFS